MLPTGKHYATGTKGWETRNSFRAGWDDGNTGFSLGTNFWGGTGEMKDFKQQTGALSIRQGDFRFNYENDGNPFGTKVVSKKVCLNNTKKSFR